MRIETPIQYVTRIQLNHPGTRNRVIIQLEVPGAGYNWFIGPSQLDRNDERRRFFFYGDCPKCGIWNAPTFIYLDDAKIWCADRGLLWIVDDDFL